MIPLFIALQKVKKIYHRKIKATMGYWYKVNSLILRTVVEAEQAQLLFSLYSLVPLIYSGSKWVNSALQAAMDNCEKLLVILTKLSASILAGEERESLCICCMGGSLQHNPLLYPWQNFVVFLMVVTMSIYFTKLLNLFILKLYNEYTVLKFPWALIKESQNSFSSTRLAVKTSKGLRLFLR